MKLHLLLNKLTEICLDVIVNNDNACNYNAKLLETLLKCALLKHLTQVLK